MRESELSENLLERFPLRPLADLAHLFSGKSAFALCCTVISERTQKERRRKFLQPISVAESGI
jgi:uncharacterized protein (DUF2384 family)